MTEYETKSAFYVFTIINQSNFGQQESRFIKVETPYHGHKSFNDAKEWIEENGNPNTEYAILEIFKRI